MRQLQFKPGHLRKYGLISIFMLSVAVFVGCKDDRYERFETPEWLKGDNIKTLQDSGVFTHFLALMDKSDYTTSIKNQNYTLFVPNDSAFEVFFKERGIDSIGDLTDKDAENLFGLHLLINGRSKDQLLYEYEWGELESPEGEHGSLFLRKVSYCIPNEYPEEVKYTPNYAGETLLIGQGAIMIPFFTKEYFEDYYGDPDGEDYLFMYRNSKWTGIQWHDAAVTKAQARTTSGFIYYIDKVVTPPPTIDKYLMDNPDKFGLFYDIAQRFASYSTRGLNDNDERVYNKNYNQITNIASANGPGGAVPAAMLYMYSAMVPTNEVLQAYLDKTVFQTYEAIDSVPELFWVNLLQSHLNDRLNIKTRMAKGLRTFYGDVVDIDVDKDILDGYMCNNGPVYTMNVVLEPSIFNCVPGNIIYNKNYTTFLYAVNSANLLKILSTPGKNITLFAPSNDKLEEYGITYTKSSTGAVSIRKTGTDGRQYTLDAIDVDLLVRDHFAYGDYDDLSGEGFIKLASNNYVYYNNDVVYSSENMYAGTQNNIVEDKDNELNGHFYTIDNVLQPTSMIKMLMGDSANYSTFINLLYAAEMVDSIDDKYEDGLKYPRIKFLAELEEWTLFAPDNQAFVDADAAGLLPAPLDTLMAAQSDSTITLSKEVIAGLKKFLEYHFVRENVIFDNGNVSGEVPSQYYIVDEEDIIYQKMTITNSPGSLSVTDKSGQTINIAHANANTLVKNGVVHMVTKCLRLE